MSGRGLTPRELDVLRVGAQGRTVAQTALELGIREGTVRTHRERAFRELGVSNLLSAVLEARRRGAQL